MTLLPVAAKQPRENRQIPRKYLTHLLQIMRRHGSNVQSLNFAVVSFNAKRKVRAKADRAFIILLLPLEVFLMHFTQRLLAFGTLAAGLAAQTAPAFAYTAYVSNEKGNSVSVIDTVSEKVIATIPVGQRPRGIAVSRDGSEVYVCLGDDNTVRIIDTKTKKTVGDLPSGNDPELLIVNPQNGEVYLSNEDDNKVTAIDAKTRKALFSIPVGVEPEGMTVSPDGKLIVNTSETTNMAHVIDIAQKKIIANVLVDQRPRFVTFKHDGSEMWVSSEVGGTVSVIDPKTWKITQKITFNVPGLAPEEIQPVGIGISRDDKLAFVALGPANRVAVVDVATHKVLKYLLVGQRVWHMDFTPDGTQLWTTNGVSNDVSIIDVASLRVIKSIPVGPQPWGVAITDK